MSSWFQDQPHLLPEGKEDDAAALGCSVAQYVLWLASVTPESASCMRTRDAFRLATFKPHFVRKFIDYISPNLIYLQKCLDGVYEKGWPILAIFCDFLQMKSFKITILTCFGCWQCPRIVRFNCRFDCGDFNAGHLLLNSYGQILHLEISFFLKMPIDEW